MDSPSLSIHSTASRRELVFSQHKNDYLHVELKGLEVSASAAVWAYTDADGINDLFQELGGLEVPWQGERSWISIEGDFSLFATCTSLGSVTFRVEIRGSQGAPEEWRVNAGLVVEFGQLEQIARSSNAFFRA